LPGWFDQTVHELVILLAKAANGRAVYAESPYSEGGPFRAPHLDHVKVEPDGRDCATVLDFSGRQLCRLAAWRLFHCMVGTAFRVIQLGNK
jgi:hypothetical protein